MADLVSGEIAARTVFEYCSGGHKKDVGPYGDATERSDDGAMMPESRDIEESS